MLLIMLDHLKALASILKERFSDLEQFDSPTWMRHPVLVDLSDVSMQYEDKLSEMLIVKGKTIKHRRSDDMALR